MAKTAVHSPHLSELEAHAGGAAFLAAAFRAPEPSLSLPLKKGVLVVGDVLLLNLTFVAVVLLVRDSLPSLGTIAQRAAAFNVLHAAWLLGFYGLGLYDIERLGSPRATARKVLEGFAVATLATLVLAWGPLSSSLGWQRVIVFHLAASACLLLAWRLGFLAWTRHGRPRKVLVCGRGSEVSQCQEVLRPGPPLGYELCAPVVVRNGRAAAGMILERFVQEQADIVAVTRALADDEALRPFLYRLVCAGVHVVEVSQLSGELSGKIPVSAIDENWFVANLREFDRGGFEIFKRALDIVAAIVLGIPTLLVFPFVALAITLDSRGAVLFRQARVGRGGRIFEIAKFRSMVHDAEKDGARWASAHDPRITRIGQVLRKTRIDELPQLWSVLRGDMSFVGPRPERPEFVSELRRTIPFYDVRHLVKPGVTGWAQINFRYGASVEDTLEKLQYDLYYIKHRSVSLDLSILLKTLGTVLRSEGR